MPPKTQNYSWGHAILIGHAEQQLQVKNKQYSINQLDATVKFHNS